MSNLSAKIAPIIANSYDFGKLNTVLDVGGGHGNLICATFTQLPEIKGCLVDLLELLSQLNNPYTFHLGRNLTSEGNTLFNFLSCSYFEF